MTAGTTVFDYLFLVVSLVALEEQSRSLRKLQHADRSDTGQATAAYGGLLRACRWRVAVSALYILLAMVSFALADDVGRAAAFGVFSVTQGVWITNGRLDVRLQQRIARLSEEPMSDLFALGRLPHNPDRPTLMLKDYLTGATPVYPPFADYLAEVTEWGQYGNDRFGTCGPAAVANQRRQVTRYLTTSESVPTDEDVFDLYRRSGNPGFDTSSGAGDGGIVLADMLSELLRGGIAGTKALAYAQVDAQSPDEVRAAIALFGSVLFGMDLDVAQREQTQAGQPWDYVRRSEHWGGHAALAGAYTSDAGDKHVDVSVVSWRRVIGTTDAFAGRQLQECYVVFWPELLGTTEFEAGVDVAALKADYTRLTGRPFPEPTPPAVPVPAPEPAPALPPAAPVSVDPDQAFRDAMRTFVAAAGVWLEGRP